MKETYIFRFRDLGKSEGFTIEQGMFGGDGGQNLVRCFHHKN